jgi:site-specific recombinase XerD
MATKYRIRGIWHIKYKDVAGEWRQKSCGRSAGAVEAEAIRKKYDSQEYNRRHDDYIRPVAADLIAQLQDFRENEIPRSRSGRPKSAKSIQRYVAIVDRFERWLRESGYLSYADITPDRMALFFDTLAKESLSASTVTKYRQILISFFNLSIKRKHCTTSPMLEIVNPKREDKAPFFWTEEQVLKIIHEAYPPYKEIFSFLYLTGLRIGELGNAEWGDYIENLGLLKIPVREGSKRKREIILPLNPKAKEIIEAQKNKGKQWIFLNAEGGKLDNGNIYNNLMYTLKRAKMPEGSPHTFRHTFASHLVINGTSLYIVKDLLGHKDIRETQIYAHLSQESLKSAVDRLSI